MPHPYSLPQDQHSILRTQEQMNRHNFRSEKPHRKVPVDPEKTLRQDQYQLEKTTDMNFAGPQQGPAVRLDFSLFQKPYAAQKPCLMASYPAWEQPP